MKGIFLLSALLLAGCASTEPALTIKFDSKPRDAYVFVKNNTRVKEGWDWRGKVPEWDPVNSDGKMPFTVNWPPPIPNDPDEDHVIPLVFKCVPMNETNTLFTKIEVCDPNTAQTKGYYRTCVIFFDLTKP